MFCNLNSTFFNALKEGKELQEFVRQQQTVECDEREKKHELKEMQLELEEHERAHERERKMKRIQFQLEEWKHELEMKKFELEKMVPVFVEEKSKEPNSKAKLSPFQDGKGELGSFLQRFE